MIVYLAQAEQNPIKSLKGQYRCGLCNKKLDDAAIYCKSCEDKNNIEDLVKLGFTIYVQNPIIKQILIENKIDYVAHDLKMIEGLMKHDTCCSKYSKCIDTIPNEYGYYLLIDRDSECAEETCNGYSHKCEEFMGNRYDSGVVCVFAEDCFGASELSELDTIKYYAYTDNEDDSFWWSSKGAKAEYDFAHAHHIRCIRLAELLEKKKIEECEPF